MTKMKTVVAIFEVPDVDEQTWTPTDVAMAIDSHFYERFDANAEAWTWSGFWTDVRDGHIGPDDTSSGSSATSRTCTDEGKRHE
jgi:hypothetical protein